MSDATPRPAPVQFRPGDLAPELDRRSDGHGLGWVAQRDLARHYECLRRSMPPLTRNEALMIVDVSNGTLWEPWSVPLLWANVADAEGLGKKWNIDQAALVDKLRRLSYAEALAVVDGAERFWSFGQGSYAISDTDDALAASGLVAREEATS